MSNKLGKISYRNQSDKSKFTFDFYISDYHAAMILQYIAQIPHTTQSEHWPPKRDKKGRFQPLTVKDIES